MTEITVNAARLKRFADVTLEQQGRPDYAAIAAALGHEYASELLSQTCLKST